jgi:hypothetical protein
MAMDGDIEGIIESSGKNTSVESSSTDQTYKAIEQNKGSLLGKRYRCTNCETEVLCVKAPSAKGVYVPNGIDAAEAYCHGKKMELVQPKDVPSSD